VIPLQPLEAKLFYIGSKNGETGYAAAYKHLTDLIISDIMMLVMDGITLCQKLKANTETKFIPVIRLTALTEDTHQIEGFNAQADDYLPKPFNSEILEARVKNLILSRRNMLDRSSNSPDIFPKVKDLVNRDEQIAKCHKRRHVKQPFFGRRVGKHSSYGTQHSDAKNKESV